MILANAFDNFEDTIRPAVDTTNSFVWGPFLIIPLILIVGVWLTASLSGIQFRKLGYGLYMGIVKRNEPASEDGDISHYQSLAIALAATVGVGNIAGVGSAIAIGGPGALFWMWVSGVIGMATKYSEAVLGVKYREVNEKGLRTGGPMYYLSSGIKNNLGKVLAISFAVFGVIASFGIGNMAQSNSVAAAVEGQWDIAPQWTGLVVMVIAGLVILGGIKAIGRFSAALVPVMIVGYISAALFVLVINVADLPAAFGAIFSQAFTGSAAVGGFAGAAILTVVRQGIARGMFSNEAGLGTAGISSAAAKTDQPVRQGMVAMTQTFIDTIVVVTLTGMVIIVTGALGMVDGEGESYAAAELTRVAFVEGLWGNAGAGIIVTLGLIVFAVSTLVGWAYYGERCLERLFGFKASLAYRGLFVAMIYVGAVASLDLVWDISDTFNGLMALPNLIGLLILTPVLVKETKNFFANPDWKMLPSDSIKDKQDNK
ncbi:alanine/glycine:cation symporter family protein [Natronoglycomyces albus]|uniref:Sodium:alanine symporter family protein n=1 Tax=Natronoglycomyces albus TaxID=2811108 RepID=A0A895XR00_9ACTN|nr:sodium:alanine symporter family protein [Natronoglycomyces albus]QSB04986.1 sodium:alanine symporter family protein [Natronoglycomyces albus]